MNKFLLKYSGWLAWGLATITSVYWLGQVTTRQCNFLQAWPLCQVGGLGQSLLQGLAVLIVTGLLGVFTHTLMSDFLTDKFELKNYSKSLVAFSVLGAIVLLPFTSADFQYYFGVGQVVLQHINPYITDWPITNLLSNEPAAISQGVMYGPLSIDLFALVVALVKGLPVVFVLLWKVLMLGAFGLVGYLVQLKFTGAKEKFWVFWLLQPLFLWEWVGNGHFDALWLIFFLAALLLAERRMWWLVSICLVISTWIKFIPIFTLPWFALWWWQEVDKDNYLKRSGEMLLSAILAFVLTVWFWQPYWVGLATVKTIITQSKWAVTSLFATIYYSLEPLFVSMLGGSSHFYLTRLVHTLLLGVVVYLLYPYSKSALLITLKKQRMSALWYTNAIFVTLAVYLLVWQKSFWPWYPLWLMPLAFMIYFQSRNEYLKKILIWLSISPLLFYVPWMASNGNLNGALFYWYAVLLIVVYPLLQLFKWRKLDFKI